ncbi:M23 family metallopeptidase [Peterkaempfera griseoplana]|uniref:M23 family metallopeptidase n=1 Tax=Peterkaempfera griseoplana TaxID=66896 RepID=UPI0006E417FC|nr:M23 family metallopeptidase [Peterkaempfera griseoplana]
MASSYRPEGMPSTLPLPDEQPWAMFEPETGPEPVTVFGGDPDRGRHRMPRQRSAGGIGSSAVVGVAAMAATLGTTGFTTYAAATAAEQAEDTHGSAFAEATDPGLALAARIQAQADSQRTAAEESARLQAARDAEAKRAVQEQAAQVAAAEDAAAKRAEEARQKKEAAERAAREAERRLLGTFTLPVTGYTLTAGFGQAGSYWSQLHTGLDFAVPTGTAVKAVGKGTVTSAGWSGSYGYRVIETLPDGTEIWYCHLSSIVQGSGSVNAGDVIARSGATGNVTGPHLHLEVRPGGGAPVDPKPWLQSHDLTP